MHSTRYGSAPTRGRQRMISATASAAPAAPASCCATWACGDEFAGRMAIIQSIDWTNRRRLRHHRCIDNGDSKMGTIENKDTIRRIYQALQTGDRSVFSASVHPDYVWRFPGHCSWSKCFTGQEEF